MNPNRTFTTIALTVFVGGVFSLFLVGTQPAELRDLHTSGIEGLELDYKLSQRADKYGNQFRFRAKLNDAQGLKLGRWAWDVFLLVNP